MTGFQPASPAEERRINILILPFPQYIAATEKTNLSVASTDDTSDQNSSVLHQFQMSKIPSKKEGRKEGLETPFYHPMLLFFSY